MTVIEAEAEVSLDLHGGISTPSVGCPRWNRQMALRSSHGEIVLGRCRAVNLCPYCARLAAVENSECLSLDAAEGIAPTMYAVLTTASTDRDPRTFYRAREKVGKALRRRWPDCEWAIQVEFTTGDSGQSGGFRRQHWNWLLKGIPDEDLAAATEVMVRVWCARADANPRGQYVDLIGERGGLMRYLSLHFAKPAQAPPIGWKGHRFLHSRGYFAAPMTDVRDQAKRSLRLKREIWKAENAGHSVHDAELLAQEAVAAAAATSWTFVKLAGALATEAEAAAVRSAAVSEAAEWRAVERDLAVWMAPIRVREAEESEYLAEAGRLRTQTKRRE